MLLERARHHVRWMIRRDMPECLALSLASHDPWSEEDFLAALRQRDHIGMVAERGDRVVGFMVYRLDEGRLTVLKMGGHGGARGEMFGRLKSKLSPHRRTAVEYPVDEYDDPSILACREAGLIAESVSRGVTDTYEFAYRLEG